MNGDGVPDLVVSAYTVPTTSTWPTTSVVVLLGKGDGTFSPPLPSSLTDDWWLVPVVADLDGDGKPDLAGWSGSGVGVVLNEGGGVFAAEVYYPLQFPGPNPNGLALAAADLDGDGYPELILAGGSAVGVLRNQGDGTFAPPVYYPAESAGYPGSLVVGDVNGDGHADVAVSGGSGVMVFLNQGDGTLGAAVTYAAGASPATLALGDLNGDGEPDLIVADQATGVSVLLNQGGVFAAPVSYPVPGALAVGIGDMDGYGKLDVIVAGVAGGVSATQGLSVLRGTGGGALAPAVEYPAGTAPRALIVADLNGDGRPDLVTWDLATSDSAGANLGVVLNRGDGTLIVALPEALPWAPVQATAVDVDGDGKPDLVVISPQGDVWVQLGEGDGTYGAPSHYALTGGPTSVAVGDLNGDGEPDLAVGCEPWTFVMSNEGGGTFGAPVEVGPPLYSLTAADLDGDGSLDLVGVDPHSGNVTVLRNQGGGTFAAPVIYPVSAASDRPGALAVGDLNGDGKPDLAVAGVTSMSVLLNAGDGTFAPAVQYSVYGATVAMGDLNGDGKPNLVVEQGVLVNEGDGTFAAPMAGTSLPGGFIVVVDMNGDGKLDVVVTSEGADTVNVLLNQGSGVFAAPLAYAAGLGPGSLMVADVNRDGRPDLVITDGQDPTLLPAPSYGVTTLLNACLP